MADGPDAVAYPSGMTTQRRSLGTKPSALLLAGAGGAGIAVAAVACAAAWMPSRAAEAAGVASGAAKSHLGTASADLVTLEMTGPEAARIFVRVNPDGTRGAGEFSPPAGSVLHVREAEFAYAHESAANGGHGLYEHVVRFRLRNKLDTASSPVVAQIPYAGTLPFSDGSRFVGAAQWRSDDGFILGAGASLVMDIGEAVNPATGDPASQAFLGTCVVRGYLVKGK